MKFSAVPRYLTLSLVFCYSFLFSISLSADDARLPGPAENEILILMDEGKWEIALEKLLQREGQVQGQLPVSFLALKAELLEGNSRHQESIAIWNGISLREASLKNYARKRVADLWLKEKNSAESEKALNRLPGGAAGKGNLSQVLALAQLFLEQGNNKKAEFYFLQSLKLTRRSEKADSARLGLAKSRTALGKRDQAIQNLRYMQVNFRSVELLREGMAMEKQLAGEPEAFSEEEFRQITKRLIDHSAFDLANEVLGRWSSSYPKSRQKDRMDYLQIEALYRQRTNEAALALCRLFPKNHPKSALKFPVYFKELLLYQRTGQTEKLVALGDKLWKGKMGGKMSSRRNVGLVMASYLVSVGQVEKGLEYYRQVYRSGPGHNSKKDILWRVGVGALRDGQDSRAVNNLRLLLQRNPKGETLASVLYWLAKAELALGNKKTALEHLIRLDEQFPNHYYNVMSHADMEKLEADVDASWITKARKKYRKKGDKFPQMALSNNVRKHKYYQAAAILSQAGLLKDAASYANTLQRVYRRDKAVAMLCARAHSAAGNHIQAVRTIYNNFRTFLYQRSDDMPSDFWTLYYPRPYWDEVSASAVKNNIDPAFLVSLMRQESRFDPNAKSWVGAIGLFQIMPYTAEEIAPQLGLGSIEEEDLYQPEINVAIAAELASRLFEYFENDRVPIIASYNAGEDRVQVWWQAARSEKISEALFIDTIPYKETRSFVRQVLSNYFSYKRIYGDSREETE